MSSNKELIDIVRRALTNAAYNGYDQWTMAPAEVAVDLSTCDAECEPYTFRELVTAVEIVQQEKAS